MNEKKKKQGGNTHLDPCGCFWQQLEQLQKELNFLEEDIKRVEVRWFVKPDIKHP